VSFAFENSTNYFNFTYTADPSINAPTIIYLNEDLRYTGGYTLNVASLLTIQRTLTKNRVELLVTGSLSDDNTVFVEITAGIQETDEWRLKVNK
jgi:hypothetical protein